MFEKQLDASDEPATLVCPNGHTRWIASNGHYWCYDCSQLHGAHPEFDEFHDPDTGEPVPESEGDLS